MRGKIFSFVSLPRASKGRRRTTKWRYEGRLGDVEGSGEPVVER